MNFILPQLADPASAGDGAATGFLALLRRRRGTFFVVFSVPLVLAFITIFGVSPSFYASGTVMIGEQESTSNSASSAWIQKLGDPADVESQLLIIKSQRMMRLALARPGVIEALRRDCGSRSVWNSLVLRDGDCGAPEFDSQEALAHVERRYTVRAVGRSRIISIGYESPLPDVAFVMANALIITYLEDQRAENARSRELSAGWLLREATRGSTGEAATSGTRTLPRPDGNAADTARFKFFTDLHKKVSDLETERRIFVNNGRLVSLAEMPKTPFFPKRTPLFAAALTIATLLGAAAATFADVTDHTVRRPRLLAAWLKIPILAELGCSNAKVSSLKRFLRWMFASKKATPRGEVWDRVCTNTSLLEESRALFMRTMLAGNLKHRRILSVSARAGEGKTFTTIILAKAAAESGRRVLVIDCNLRHPAVAESLELSVENGLAEILRGECTPQQAVMPTPVPNLEIIAAGRLRNNPTMLLMDSRLSDLMTWSEGYDLVLMDGPAFEPYPDAGLLARQTDAVVWCARWGQSLQYDVRSGVEALRKCRNTVLGIVVTGTDFKELTHYERVYQPHLAISEAI